MTLLSLQILLLNFAVAGVITALIYYFSSRIKVFNLFLVFSVSCLGAFTGTLISIFMPDFILKLKSNVLQTIILTIPGFLMSLLFIFLMVKGSKSESYI